jgi:hypothetical protein
MVAAPETPDTPRAAARPGGEAFARFALTVACALPRCAPMITTGFEIGERQPLNLGLDATEEDRRRLDPDDPQYGLLAFFDLYALHWTSPGAAAMVTFCREVLRVRRELLAWSGPGRGAAIRTLPGRASVFGSVIPGPEGRAWGMVANGDSKQSCVIRFRVGYPSVEPAFSSVTEDTSLPVVQRGSFGLLRVGLKPFESLLLRFSALKA